MEIPLFWLFRGGGGGEGLLEIPDVLSGGGGGNGLYNHETGSFSKTGGKTIDDKSDTKSERRKSEIKKRTTGINQKNSRPSRETTAA